MPGPAGSAPDRLTRLVRPDPLTPGSEATLFVIGLPYGTSLEKTEFRSAMCEGGPERAYPMQPFESGTAAGLFQGGFTVGRGAAPGTYSLVVRQEWTEQSPTEEPFTVVIGDPRRRFPRRHLTAAYELSDKQIVRAWADPGSPTVLTVPYGETVLGITEAALVEPSPAPGTLHCELRAVHNDKALVALVPLTHDRPATCRLTVRVTGFGTL
ncbi:hypothetical protein [Streptomyces sp. NPDC051162]|uniref:hypothetical protein n=1 Tax=unclassified Streptomyces TaxID=2593676 RepID=UPI0034344395